MHIISKSFLTTFATENPNYKTALDSWYRIVSKTDFADFNALRQTFPSADVVKNAKDKNLTVFNIHGNSVRLIAAIHYNSQKIYIRDILTHAEYSKDRWQH